MIERLSRLLRQILQVSILLPFATHASETFTSTQTVAFKDFHDPGYLLVEQDSGEAFKLWFHYEFIPYEDVLTWERGETLKLGIDPTRGSGVFRVADAKFYKVFFSDEHDPIDSVEDRCLEANGSTMGIAQCYSETYRYVSADISYLIRDLGTRRNLGYQTNNFASSMKTARQAYAALFSAVWDQRGGSVGTINQMTTMLRLMHAEKGALEGLY
ncbi:hypothetical protein [Congregibacter litoralis]|uniref:Uncharacterized protein n=1 Tax=Congregibacter litoralis KT71 TaxID=314285 RepID=A4AB59_9GAMM|nr:hypothetical protein [Congregibacter litoralis]EAQ96931.1 hypothetical protein KT71_11539 [Congregibacter litoralis KT71]